MLLNRQYSLFMDLIRMDHISSFGIYFRKLIGFDNVCLYVINTVLHACCSFSVKGTTLKIFWTLAHMDNGQKFVNHGIIPFLSGNKVFVHGTVCTPFALLNALVEHGEHANLKNVELFHVHLEGDAKWTQPKYAG